MHRDDRELQPRVSRAGQHPDLCLAAVHQVTRDLNEDDFEQSFEQRLGPEALLERLTKNQCKDIAQTLDLVQRQADECG